MRSVRQFIRKVWKRCYVLLGQCCMLIEASDSSFWCGAAVLVIDPHCVWLLSETPNISNWRQHGVNIKYINWKDASRSATVHMVPLSLEMFATKKQSIERQL